MSLASYREDSEICMHKHDINSLSNDQKEENISLNLVNINDIELEHEVLDISSNLADIIILTKIYLRKRNKDIIDPILKELIDLIFYDIPELNRCNIYNKIFTEFKTNENIRKLLVKLFSNEHEFAVKKQILIEVDRWLDCCHSL